MGGSLCVWGQSKGQGREVSLEMGSGLSTRPWLNLRPGGKGSHLGQGQGEIQHQFSQLYLRQAEKVFFHLIIPGTLGVIPFLIFALALMLKIRIYIFISEHVHILLLL